MLRTNSVSFISVSDLAEALGIQEDVIFDNVSQYYSYGDAAFTLIGNNIFYHNVIKDLVTAEKYWSVIPANAYINLEN